MDSQIKFTEYVYKGIKVECFVGNTGLFYCRAMEIFCSNKKGNRNGYHQELSAAKADVEKQVDDFLKETAITWEELAEKLTNTLGWL